MGQPVVHFEVIGRDGDKLKAYYSDLFGWEFEDAQGPMNYGAVQGEGTPAPTAAASAAARATPGHVTFYVAVPDIDAALTKAESLGGKRLRVPDEVPGAGIVIANDGIRA